MADQPLFVNTVNNKHMIYSLYGENNFVMIMELDKLVANFKLKNHEIYRYAFNDYNPPVDTENNNNYLTTDNLNISHSTTNSYHKDLLHDIFYHLSAIGLFVSTKLIIIKYLNEKELSKKDQDFLKASLKKIEDSSNLIVIFVNQKTLSLFSRLKVKKQEFKKLSANDLSKFIDQIAQNNQVKLTSQAKNLLISSFSDDAGVIYNEIIKLSNYKSTINDHDILELSKLPELTNIFGLTDAIAAKNKKLAIKLLWQEYNAGTFDLAIFGTIVNHIRNALLIKSHQNSPQSIVDIHHFVQQKLLPFVNSFSLQELKLMLSNLCQYDLKIKKGKINAMLALELFINDNI